MLLSLTHNDFQSGRVSIPSGASNTFESGRAAGADQNCGGTEVLRRARDREEAGMCRERRDLRADLRRSGMNILVLTSRQDFCRIEIL